MGIRLTGVQEGIYVSCAARPESTHYNLPFLGRLTAPADPEKLRSAILKAVSAHPVLNSVLREQEDGSAVLEPAAEPFEVPVIKVSDEEFEKIKENLVRPFSLSGEKLSRIEIYVTESSLYMFEDIHHIICDGSTSGVLAEDIRLAFDDVDPETESLSLSGLAEAEEKWLSSDDAAAVREYWKQYLEGFGSGCLPEPDTYDESKSQKRFIRDFSLDEDRLSGLRHKEGFSTTSFFASAFAVALSVFSGQEDILFNYIVSGRDDSNRHCAGMFVRTLPFRINTGKYETAKEMLKDAGLFVEQGRANSAYPYIRLAEELGIKAEIEFGYQRDITDNQLIKDLGIDVTRIYDDTATEDVPLLFEVIKKAPGSYAARVGYWGGRYSEKWIESFTGTFAKIASELLIKENISDFGLISDDDLEFLDGCNATETEREDLDVVSMFRRSAAAFPERTAVFAGGRAYTYRETDRITDALASKLREAGIGRGSVVSVLVRRNAFMPLASLGVLKSGAAYQPLDPGYPVTRLGFMVRDASSSLLIADRDLGDKMDFWKGPVLFTDEIMSLPDKDPFDAGIRPDDTFILLYTSGTTGTPKGIMLSHGNVSDFAQWGRRYFGLDENDRCLSYASYGFDANLVDLYPTLTCGAAVYIIPEEIRLDLGAISDYINENGITCGIMTTQVGRQFATAYKGGSFRHLIVGGEVLVPLDPDKIQFKVSNAYGPTECTVLATIQPVDRLYHRIPIGRAVENVKLYVADRFMRRLPPFAPGELLIAGPRVSKGYLNLPEKTAASFIPNPYTDRPRYGRLYRTGDIVRMLRDGKADFIGRRDSQVKIRGFRIELSEVESVIRDYPGIKDATVSDFTDASTGMKYIAAYVVSDEKIDIQALSAFIKDRKPSYMVPAVTMQLDSIPLTANNKVDRRALPVPRRETGSFSMPETPDEEKVYNCLAEALGHRDFGVDTDTEEAGLSSIGAMHLNVLLSKAFGIPVRIGDMRSLNTVRDIAAFFSKKHDGGTASADAPAPKRKLYPLSSAQMGVYVECLANPDSTVYNVPFIFRLHPGVDLKKLKSALVSAANAHPYVKARLVADGGKIMAERNDRSKIKVRELKLSSLPAGFADLIRPFRLTQEPLSRFAIVRDGGVSYLFMDLHHIAFDGESLSVFMADVEKAYSGTKPDVETYTGFEYALEQELIEDSPAYTESKEYFAALLDGAETDCRPPRDRKGPVSPPDMLTADVELDRSAIDSFTSGEKVTRNALCNAAFSLMLSRFLYRKDCVYATVYNGRDDSRLSGSVGMFVKTFPVVARPDPEETGGEFARRIGRQLTKSMANGAFPFSDISKTFGMNLNILFAYEGDLGSVERIGGLPAESIPVHPNAIKSPLTFFVYDTEKGFRLECEYAPEEYEPWNIRSMLLAMEQALRSIISGAKLSEISLLYKEAEEKLALFNKTDVPVEKTDMATLFRRAAGRYPDRTAVIYKDKKLTYRELDRLSDNIAAYAKGAGAGPGSVVSILVPRSEYMAVCALGALKSGAAYQPLDPGYPPERLGYMVEDADAGLLIADRELITLLPDYRGPVLFLDQIPSLPDHEPGDAGLSPSSLFILLYTSGTTGQPKGVMLEHGNLVNFCGWYRTYYGLTPDSVVGAYASFGFDACMMDLYPALTAGAAVCIVPEDIRLDLPVLDRYYSDNGVTHVFMTTQMGRIFATSFPGTGIRYLSTGGETLVPLAPPDGFRLVNGYGPTECTVFCTTQPVDQTYDRVPIGSPLFNYRLYVVDEFGHQLPPGALGELWVAGHGVGRGYLNKPDVTARVFTENPFSSDPGFDRVFRTGDVVRRLGDGRIDFIGRNDGQVKIRGFRVELSEVEGVIREFPGIKDVTVQAFDSEGGGKYIAAYIVSDEKADFQELSDFIRDKKPSYMVPAAFMQLDSIPLTRNQKVDRRALPQPELRKDSRGFTEPSTPLEKEICGEFAKILGLEKVSATDSFFDIGGSSIKAAEVVTYAMSRGYPVVYKDVFSNPSARELARVINGLGSSSKSKTVADFDYTDIDRLISFNSMENVDEISTRPLGDIILTGPTGFLGIHVLRAFCERFPGKVTCLMRRGKFSSAEQRLKTMLFYYFGNTMEELFGKRIFCAEGDITDTKSLRALEKTGAACIINCAACVKHFTNDDTLDKVNFRGVENLADLCVRSSMRLVHISTLSVGGLIESGNETVLKENMLYFGQNTDNDYVRTKFLAERAILDARVSRGLDAVILRAGNLMGRHSDGEFQINFRTNSFIRSLCAYVSLGSCPVNVFDQPVEFSPIDCVADAVLTLGGADPRFSVFNMNNNHSITMGDVIDAINRHGFRIRTVSEAEFGKILDEAARNEDESGTVMSLVAYREHKGEDLRMVGSDCRFTTGALFRLGFRWPIIGNAYLEKAITALDTLGFFPDTK
ncbi:MAG: amino acid adenylation domain-containing protein [Clostridia bacterium]|nr:amino acid adenylation domain-containing protein [Clostridia bacterium]